MSAGLARTELPNLLARGKVRDIYDLGQRLLLVATDRISAFDVVMNEPVPGKGEVLTQITAHWLRTLPACNPHHLEYLVSCGTGVPPVVSRVPPGYEPFLDQLAGRSMVVRKAHVLPIECVVRGYLVGGGWKVYLATGGPERSGTVSGVRLPRGLRLADRLAEPIFTPSTKAASGHDEPLSFEQALEMGAAFGAQVAARAPARSLNFDERGRAWVEQARDRSLAIYTQAAEYAAKRGMIIADTKFEFGVSADVGGESNGGGLPQRDELLLIDEVLTPDSSRFWPAAEWRPCTNPPSFDKQFLRDYLESTGWDKKPPPPRLPQAVLDKTAEKYREALRLLTLV